MTDGEQTMLERRNIDDLRERIVRNEQNHLNLKENFQDFKVETQGEFNTLSGKIDRQSKKIDDMGANLGTEINTIKMTIAKWFLLATGAPNSSTIQGYTNSTVLDNSYAGQTLPLPWALETLL